MSGGNEIGISPALLQAITHTISTKSLPDTISADHQPLLVQPKHSIIVRDAKYQHTKIIKVEGQGHSIEQIQEAITALGEQNYHSGNTIFVVQNSGDVHKDVDHLLPVVKLEDSAGCVDIETTLPETAPSVVSLITSQASHHAHPNNIETINPITNCKSAYCESTLIKVVSDGLSSPSVLAAGDLAVSQVDNVITETVIQTSYCPEPLVNMENIRPSQSKKVQIIELPEVDAENTKNAAAYMLNNHAVGSKSVALATNHGGFVYHTVSSAVASVAAEAAIQSIQHITPNTIIPAEYVAGCPICGDKVSGYHYGIYSCESCKGFFKRTVQNKKAFICHRLGECAVSIGNRKKCPACRFKQCLTAGMKLEAIREDRTRGGRSSYDGCSPHRPVKISREPHKPQRIGVLVNPIMIQTSTGSIAIPPTVESTPSPVYTLSPQTSSASKSTQPKPVDITQVQPQTPQLLEDLMAVESLMTEDEGEQTCCDGKLVHGDINIFASLLHFADHCLYKIVRWARNLPDFASVSTDDQIVLLQNCWAELLCLCCCWKSLRSAPGTLKLYHGRVFTIEQATDIGLEEMVQRMLDITDSLRELEMDNYEFVTMKGLLLLSPDVKNLKDEGGIRKYQDRLIESLMIYTTTNSPTKAGKFCQLLARLPELTRCCVLGKDQLSERQLAGEVPQYSLLSELLKGDGAMS